MRETLDEEIVLLHEGFFGTPVESDFVLGDDVRIVGGQDHLEVGAIANVEGVFQIAQMRVLHNHNLASLHFDDVSDGLQILVVGDEHDRATDGAEAKEG